MNLLFPITIFLSAFLLFQVQPMMGRYVLPWFGGTPGVWSVCLLFFQFLLLAGYTYAHVVGTMRDFRKQGIIHLSLLAASLLLLPIMPDPDLWKPDSADSPALRILLLLAACIGGPYFLLSATTPLVQRWFNVSYPGRSHWRLYALSNIGSFLALFSYPILLEPYLSLGTQGWVWSGAYIGFVALCGFVAWRVRSVVPDAGVAAMPVQVESPVSEAAFEHSESQGPPSIGTIAFWLALAATASALLMGSTNLISQDIAVAPFLWILPLSVYLLTFILTFESDRWYRRMPFAILMGIVGPAAVAIMSASVGIEVMFQLASYLVVLFIACMVCHGELALSRPAPEHLTKFYLCVSAGGVVGGAFVALLAPALFVNFTEYPLALLATCLLGLVGWLRSGAYARWSRGEFAVRVPLMAMLFGALTLFLSLGLGVTYQGDLGAYRSFYGVMHVSSHEDELGREYYQLSHGRIKHGAQYQEGEIHDEPVSYYGDTSGMALLMNALGNRPKRIGVVGLGTGTMAAWGNPGDVVRFYEIDPEVEQVAREWFSYLDDSPAEVSVVLGDARVQLERELAAGNPGNYDVMVVDAFSSDAIPIHLLTAECAEIYKQHLKPGGVLMIHISNLTLDLDGVVRGLAEHLGWTPQQLYSDGKLNGQNIPSEDPSRWVAVTSDDDFLVRSGINAAAAGWTDQETMLWTDDFASLWHVIDW